MDPGSIKKGNRKTRIGKGNKGETLRERYSTPICSSWAVCIRVRSKAFPLDYVR